MRFVFQNLDVPSDLLIWRPGLDLMRVAQHIILYNNTLNLRNILALIQSRELILIIEWPLLRNPDSWNHVLNSIRIVGIMFWIVSGLLESILFWIVSGHVKLIFVFRDEHSLIAQYCQNLHNGDLTTIVPDSPMQIMRELDAKLRHELEIKVR